MKKLSILVASVLGASLLAIAPAQAAPMTVAIEKDTTAGATTTWTADTTLGRAATTPITRPVPEDNVINDDDVVKFIASVDTGTAVSVTATNATIVSATNAAAAPVSASSGSSTLTIATGTGNSATFYVYTKTTAVGTVIVQNQGTTLTFYVQGVVGKVNTLSISSADAGTTSSVVTATATATDVFGNKVPSIGLTALVVGGTLDVTTANTGDGLTNYGSADFKVTLPSTGQSTLVVRVTDTTANGAVAVAGFNTPVTSAVKTITVRDLLGELAAEKAAHDATKATAATAATAAATAATKAAADLAAANAEIAKLKADSATATTANANALAAKDAEIAKLKADNAAALKAIKDAFNALAKKWNAKNPKAKVALVK